MWGDRREGRSPFAFGASATRMGGRSRDILSVASSAIGARSGREVVTRSGASRRAPERTEMPSRTGPGGPTRDAAPGLRYGEVAASPIVARGPWSRSAARRSAARRSTAPVRHRRGRASATIPAGRLILRPVQALRCGPLGAPCR